MAKLAVNIDHVATLREARGGVQPDPVLAAGLAELGGAEGITCHLREDRRHVKERDLSLLRQTVKTKLNMEMAAEPEVVEIALRTLPDMVTLVPERREELTTEGGLDVAAGKDHYAGVVERMKEKGIRVSFFVNPDPNLVEISHGCGADVVEIHTGSYSEARSEAQFEERFRRIVDAVKCAAGLNMGINAGHGLNYTNIRRFESLKEIDEFSIGHSIVSRAVMVGFERAVKEMFELIKNF